MATFLQRPVSEVQLYSNNYCNILSYLVSIGNLKFVNGSSLHVDVLFSGWAPNSMISFSLKLYHGAMTRVFRTDSFNKEPLITQLTLQPWLLSSSIKKLVAWRVQGLHISSNSILCLVFFVTNPYSVDPLKVTTSIWLFGTLINTFWKSVQVVQVII